MSLAERLESAYVALFGNRAIVLSELLITGSIIYDELVSNNGNLPTGSAILCAIGGAITGVTYAGTGTWKHYKRTLREYKEKGEVSVDFFKERILRSENGRFVGYCQLQGLYLGAKKTGQLEAFYAAREEFSECKIPNF